MYICMYIYFFFWFFSLPSLYLRCELSIWGYLPSCSIKSKLVGFLRANTTILASDLVPCIQSDLFIWFSLSPGTDRLPSVSSPLCFCHPGNTRVQVEPEKQAPLCWASPQHLAQASAYTWKQEDICESGVTEMKLKRWNRGKLQKAWCHPGLVVLELFS